MLRHSIIGSYNKKYSACDSQVGSEGDISGGCALTQGTSRPVVHERSSGPHAFPLPVRVPPCKMWDDVIEEDVPPQPEVPEEAPPAAEEAPVEAEPPPPEPAKPEEPKKLVFKHWVRPKFLQYNYMYDYRHNYYDDVINYLDKRNKGLLVEKPRAQTWAERALRTYVSKSSSSIASRLNSRDAALLRHVSTGARFHRYHTKSLIARKYSELGFNTISI